MGFLPILFLGLGLGVTIGIGASLIAHHYQKYNERQWMKAQMQAAHIQPAYEEHHDDSDDDNSDDEYYEKPFASGIDQSELRHRRGYDEKRYDLDGMSAMGDSATFLVESSPFEFNTKEDLSSSSSKFSSEGEFEAYGNTDLFDAVEANNETVTRTKSSDSTTEDEQSHGFVTDDELTFKSDTSSSSESTYSSDSAATDDEFVVLSPTRLPSPTPTLTPSDFDFGVQSYTASDESVVMLDEGMESDIDE
ncbi:hypothetical protein V1512DRAFT_264607 [Lipomyces arxii]|uniref:uncharacterized protein n=1 Tax=Lipomyces arxii TaxID=56418 RepID=UPI0034CF0B8B